MPFEDGVTFLLSVLFLKVGCMMEEEIEHFITVLRSLNFLKLFLFAVFFLSEEKGPNTQ